MRPLFKMMLRQIHPHLVYLLPSYQERSMRVLSVVNASLKVLYCRGGQAPVILSWLFVILLMIPGAV